MPDLEAKLKQELEDNYRDAFIGLERVAADRGDGELLSLCEALKAMSRDDPRDPWRRTAVATMMQVIHVWLIGGQSVGRILEFTSQLTAELLRLQKGGTR